VDAEVVVVVVEVVAGAPAALITTWNAAEAALSNPVVLLT